MTRDPDRPDDGFDDLSDGTPPPHRRRDPGVGPLDPDQVANWSDADFWSMARRVRQTAEAELAEIEYETDRAEIKREDLTARAIRAMMEGERWQIVAGPRVVEGIVVHVGLDFVGLQDRAGNLHDVAHRALEVIRLVALEPTEGRAPITLRPATFRARLLGLEEARPVELAATTGSWVLQGTIESVNNDHLVLIDANQTVSLLPLAAIGSVSRTPLEHRRRGRGRRPDRRG